MPFKDEPNLQLTAVVPNAGTTPAAGIDLLGLTLCGVYVPASVEGTTLAFTAATTLAGTYVPVHGTDGNAVSYTIGSSRYVPFDPAVFAGIRFLKIVVSAQTGDATFTLATRRLG